MHLIVRAAHIHDRLCFIAELIWLFTASTIDISDMGAHVAHFAHFERIASYETDHHQHNSHYANRTG